MEYYESLCIELASVPEACMSILNFLLERFVDQEGHDEEESHSTAFCISVLSSVKRLIEEELIPLDELLP